MPVNAMHTPGAAPSFAVTSSHAQAVYHSLLVSQAHTAHRSAMEAAKLAAEDSVHSIPVCE